MTIAPPGLTSASFTAPSEPNSVAFSDLASVSLATDWVINHEGSRSTTMIQKIVQMLGWSLIRMAWMRMNRKSTGHDAQGGHRVCKIKSSILGFCETFIDKKKSKSPVKITPTWVIILSQK
ncbi:hypothetical protein V8G54_010688 [Vigna mungo]|uniref:Uncharacterized protein n=1 Tax=Vigna mungo TaxID=3915 RepID=A0AAQ3NYZ3_VIGMU